MSETIVLDASIAIKWVVEEEGSEDAARLLSGFRFMAPDLIIPECTNILWKKVYRKELSNAEAAAAADLLATLEISLISSSTLMSSALRWANALDRPAYDCFYLALAVETGCRFVTADAKFLAAVGSRARPDIARLCLHYRSGIAVRG